MERLTVYTPDGYESINPVDLCLDEYSDINFERILDKLGAYEDFEEIFREKMPNAACDLLSDKEEFGKWLDRNKWIAKKCDEWARAEEQGSLVILPYKYVYYIVDINNSGYARVAKRFIKVLAICEIESIDKENCKYFSTKEKAEERLKELRCNND
jgi:hypothetical protein